MLFRSDERIDDAVFSYSDVTYDHVMHVSARVMAAGANFMLLGPAQTMLPSTKPVVAICASRTGAGKSQTSRAVVRVLRELGQRVVSVRHPMPYGNLVAQAVQRFATIDDHSGTRPVTPAVSTSVLWIWNSAGSTSD